jgi:hypothetical protein
VSAVAEDSEPGEIKFVATLLGTGDLITKQAGGAAQGKLSMVAACPPRTGGNSTLFDLGQVQSPRPAALGILLRVEVV